MLSRSSSPRSSRSPRAASPVSVLRFPTADEASSSSSESPEYRFCDATDDLICSFDLKQSLHQPARITTIVTYSYDQVAQTIPQSYSSSRHFSFSMKSCPNKQPQTAGSFNLPLNALRCERTHQYSKYFKDMTMDGCEVGDHSCSASLLRSSFRPSLKQLS